MSSLRSLRLATRLGVPAATATVAALIACGSPSSDTPGAPTPSNAAAGDAAPLPAQDSDAGSTAVPTQTEAGTTPPGAIADAGLAATPTDGGTGGGAEAGGLDPKIAPGGNFDLTAWELQEPVGTAGQPTTFLPAQLAGPHGHQDAYFYTDPIDGSMVFFDPENGVTTANSDYPRSELREMTASGQPASWSPPGTHTLAATLAVTRVPSHVAVGQIHLGTGTPASTKPLLEVFYEASGAIVIGIEQSPAGGNEIEYDAGHAPLGAKWSYRIGLSGSTITLSIDGAAPQTWTMASSFDDEGMYFKAGDYDQSVGPDASVAAQVQFYALSVTHTP